MERSLMIALLVLVAVLTGVNFYQNNDGQDKFLIILQAGTATHEGMARAVHALLYTQELRDHDHDVILVFDGAGTEWVERWLSSEEGDKLANQFHELQREGLAYIVCDYCAGAFHVKKAIQEKDAASLIGEYEGHPSIARWVKMGYQLLVL